MNWLEYFKKPRVNIVSSVLEFKAIDTDGMIKAMRLIELGKERGEKNLPSSDSEGFDSVEQSIINEIEAQVKVDLNLYLDHQTTYADRAKDATIGGLVHQVTASVEDAITDFEQNTHIGTGELYACKRSVIESASELTRFREEHDLKRPPRDYGTIAGKVGILVLILAIEAILNGFFLSKGSDFGLIGGIFQAIIIASINVFVGVSIGRHIFPWLFHKSITMRALAAAGALTYLLANVGFNLATAHYRNAVGVDPSDASALAYKSLLANPLGVNDLQSWSLFIVGFLFSLIAAVDGLRMNDPYPGYGQRMKQNLAALDDYNDLKTELLSALDEIKKSAEKKLDDLISRIQSRVSEYGYIALKSRTLKSRVLEHFLHLESSGNTLLSCYRDECRKNRQTLVPSRFNVAWKYIPPPVEESVVPEKNPNVSDRDLQEALEEARKQRGALHNAFRRAYAKYKLVDHLVDGEGHT